MHERKRERERERERERKREMGEGLGGEVEGREGFKLIKEQTK